MTKSQRKGHPPPPKVTKGEASNPGPSKKKEGADRESTAKKKIKVETINADAKTPLKKWLEQTLADIVCAQEVKVNAQEAKELSQWAKQHGWKAIITPCDAGETAKERSAGVAIFVRANVGLGLGHIAREELSHGARGLIVKVEAKGMPDLAIATTYMHHSEAWTQRSLEIHDWAVSKLALASLPFIWGDVGA